MSFEGYLRNIETKTGRSPEDFMKLAKKEGFMAGDRLREDVRVANVVLWLRDSFGLGHGHAMAIVALLKGKRPSV